MKVRRLLLTLGLLFVAGPCWGAIARVNQGCFANITISGGAITQAIGWTTASGNFFVVQVATPGAGTITGATASGTSMTLDAGPVTDVVSTALLRLANTGSVSSVTITITGNNGGAASFCAAEYSGVSLTATPVNTAVTGMSGFESSTNTWTNGSYTATAGNLVLSGAAATLNGQTWGAGSGWTMVGSDDSVSSAGLMLEEQLNVGAGGFVGTGTLTMVTTFGTRFVYYTVSYPAIPSALSGVAIQSMDSFVWYVLIAALGFAHGFLLAAAKLAYKVGYAEHKAVCAVRDFARVRVLDGSVLVAKT